MKYNIVLSDTAFKDLGRLEKKHAEIVLNKLNGIAEDPISFLERLHGMKLWKLRAGEYRAVCAVDVKNMIVFVSMVGHRKNIYQRLYHQKCDII